MNPTGIEWVRNKDGSKGHVWNPIRARDKKTGRLGKHCEPVHEGCRFCWADKLNRRDGAMGGTGHAYKPGNRDKVDIFLDDKVLTAPLRKRKATRVFVCSTTDLFGEWVSDAWRDKMFAAMALSPQHTFIVLTKRPAEARAYLSAPGVLTRVHERALDLSGGNYSGAPWPLPNVWLLVSCSTQDDADKFVPILLATPAAKRGVSLEPLLGAIDLEPWLPWPDTDVEVNGKDWGCQECDDDRACDCPNDKAVWRSREIPPYDEDGCPSGIHEWRLTLDWVITGGESGDKDQDVRPMHPAHERSLREQCAAAGVAYFRKQWGEYAVLPTDRARDKQHIFLTKDWDFVRVGKKRAGNLLDGVKHEAWPDQPAEAAAI